MYKYDPTCSRAQLIAQGLHQVHEWSDDWSLEGLHDRRALFRRAGGSINALPATLPPNGQSERSHPGRDHRHTLPQDALSGPVCNGLFGDWRLCEFPGGWSAARAGHDAIHILRVVRANQHGSFDSTALVPNWMDLLRRSGNDGRLYSNQFYHRDILAENYGTPYLSFYN